MITSWTISQLLRLRHAKAEAKAHAATDKVASAQDVAAMFRTSDALRLLCLAKAWAEETIVRAHWFQLCAATAVSLSALRVDGAPLNVLLAANAKSGPTTRLSGADLTLCASVARSSNVSLAAYVQWPAHAFLQTQRCEQWRQDSNRDLLGVFRLSQRQHG